MSLRAAAWQSHGVAGARPDPGNAKSFFLGLPRCARNDTAPRRRGCMPAASCARSAWCLVLSAWCKRQKQEALCLARCFRPTPYALRPTPYALRLTPYALRLTPFPLPAARCLSFLSRCLSCRACGQEFGLLLIQDFETPKSGHLPFVKNGQNAEKIFYLC